MRNLFEEENSNFLDEKKKYENGLAKTITFDGSGHSKIWWSSKDDVTKKIIEKNKKSNENEVRNLKRDFFNMSLLSFIKWKRENKNVNKRNF